MNKSKRNIILLVVLTVLAGLYFLSDVFFKNNESTFDPNIIKIDTTQITKLIIYQKDLNGDSMILELKNGNWEMRSKELITPASAGSIHNLFLELAAFKPERLASTSDKDWAEFMVNDTSYTRFVAMDASNQIVADLLLGKISFQSKSGQGMYGNQQRNVDGISYFRLNNEEETYAANSFLAMIVNTPPAGWRERTLAQINPTDITQIKVKTPGYAYTLELKDKTWYLGETAIDTSFMTNYLTQFTYIALNEFEDNIKVSGAMDYELSVETSVASPITISGQTLNDSTLLVRSSINPALFRMPTSNRLFLGGFMKPEEFVSKK